MALNAGIAHKNLTDPQLHEPKGASTAEENAVMIANGDGSTDWRMLSVDLLGLIKPTIQTIDDPSREIIEKIDDLGLDFETHNTLIGAWNFEDTNVNVKTLAITVNKLVEIIAELRTENDTLREKINTTLTRLAEEGIITNG